MNNKNIFNLLSVALFFRLDKLKYKKPANDLIHNPLLVKKTEFFKLKNYENYQEEI